MPFTTTEIPGLLLFEPPVFEDNRGSFFESYNEKVFKEQGIDVRWVQDNQSSSFYGVIRGLQTCLHPVEPRLQLGIRVTFRRLYDMIDL